jgi:hypothetical protein
MRHQYPRAGKLQATAARESTLRPGKQSLGWWCPQTGGQLPSIAPLAQGWPPCALSAEICGLEKNSPAAWYALA